MEDLAFLWVTSLSTTLRRSASCPLAFYDLKQLFLRCAATFTSPDDKTVTAVGGKDRGVAWTCGKESQ